MRKNILLTISVIILFYLLFPTNNSTLDAYGYASSIKYGFDLFKPHHLFYNVFLYVINKILILLHLNFDVLSITKTVNALFQFVNLYILFKILELLRVKYNEIIVILIIVGFSYSPLRFGTENENYIIPITFSLIASFYFLKFNLYKKYGYLFLSGLFASIACLFHQIHFFWWLGLFLGLLIYQKNIKAIFYYSITALIVPLTYFFVIYFYKNETLNYYNIIHFVLHDYYMGSAKSEFGINNFIFIVVSTIRTFFQVHPIIIKLIKRNFIYFIPILILTILIFTFFKQLLKRKFIKKNVLNNNGFFIKTHLIILIFYFLFAFYAVGNVEFMVMIPFLIFISVFYYYKVNIVFLKKLAFTLFIWNIMYGLFPNNYYHFYNDEVLVDFIIAHPNDTFLVHEHTVLNQFTYKTGIERKHLFRLKNYDKLMAEKPIKKDYFYTDIINKPKIFNRAYLIENKDIKFNQCRKELIKTYDGLYGTSFIYKVYY